jgi:DNA-binding transcriptional regulator GbsR (MarR family)
MSAAEGEFVDRLGLVMERLGGPSTIGRMYAWLLICAPPEQSLTELARCSA